MRVPSLLVLATGAFALAACGTTDTNRALSGAGIGAGSGALVGAATGLGPATGALLGAGVGGAVGVFTDPKDLNLGDPVWE